MLTRVITAGILGLASCIAIAASDLPNVSATFADSDFIVADTRGQDRREDRGDDKDDRQDCRKDEGRVGKDKRDCKQDNRRDDDDDDA